MDENTWRFAQLILAGLGIQTTILIALFGFMWKNMNNKFDAIDKLFDKMDKRLESLEEKVTDIDRRLCRMEGAFSMKECCRLSPDVVKKAA